jgi:hypothetical protein
MASSYMRAQYHGTPDRSRVASYGPPTFLETANSFRDWNICLVQKKKKKKKILGYTTLGVQGILTLSLPWLTADSWEPGTGFSG